MRKENGRSMIEMLGVLAIIGVISIGGISLYRRAVDTNKANNIFDDVNRFEFVISERIDRAPEGQINHGDFNPISGFEMIAYNEPSLQSHHIRVSDVPKSVCRIVLEKGESKYVMYANNLIFEGDSNICRDTNEMRFYFGETDDLCSVPELGTNQEACSDGCLCREGNECKTDVYNKNYPNPMPAEQIQNPWKVCCPKGNDIVACNNQCVDGTCTGENMFFNPKECACTCTDPDTMEYVAEQNKCICGKDKNGVQLVLKNGKCVCPDAGFTLADGKCSKIDCRNGTTGRTFQCYINDISCGYNCLSSGDNCVKGVCHAKNCPDGEKFVQKVVPNGNASYSYACQRDISDGYTCYRWWDKTITVSSSYPYSCYKNGQYCCDTNNATTFECTSGLCNDQSRCTAINKDAQLVGNYCSFPDKLTCSYDNGLWTCYKYGYYCANCTSEEIKNNECCTGTSCKVSKEYTGTYNADTERCEYTVGGETISCTTKDIPVSNISQVCYAGDVKRCVIYITKGHLNGNNYASGRCSPTEANCPEGTEYAYIDGLGRYDCKNKTPNTPACGYNDTNIACYYNSAKCGQRCDYFGQNCTQVYLPQCAASGHCPQTGYDMGKAADLCTCDGAVTSNVSVEVSDGNGGTTTEKHSFCCPTGHTYVNGGCAM